MNEVQVAFGAGELDGAALLVDGDDGDVHAVLHAGSGVESEFFGHLLVERTEDLLRVGDVLAEHNVVEQVVAHDGHEAAGTPCPVQSAAAKILTPSESPHQKKSPLTKSLGL